MFHYLRLSLSRLILFSFLLLSLGVWAQDKNEEALSKTANELFASKEYKKAKDVYSQLISLYPKNENYNYRFGACLLFVDKDKEFPIKFLEYAVTQPNVDVEAFYYMGKGYHYNLRFDDAIPYYQKYLAKVSVKEKNPLPAKDEIRYCNNGKELLTDIKEPSILSKFKVNESDFYVSIKLKPMGGRVLNGPKELQSSYDKKQGYTPIMYVNTKTDVVYFSSYGKDGSTGLDIYQARVKSDGNLDKAVKLSSQINTTLDESFPFMNEDETVFYFASTGHNSMGGYDIFKSDYNLDAETFSSPVNLDYSINTPDNDFMYATVTKEGYAFFVSDRNSAKGKVTVFKIDAEINAVQSVILKGVFSSKSTKSCKITVTDVDRNEQVGTYSTNKTTGDYTMRLHQGGNYSFLVEPYGGQIAYKGNVKLPANSDSDLNQEIEIVADNETERLIIRNLFGDQPLAKTEDTSLEDAPKEVDDPLVVTHNVDIDTEISSTKKEIQEYIGENKKNANLSYTIANQKRELAQQDLAMAEQLEQTISLNDESDENKKKQEELNRLMQDAYRHTNEAEAAFSLGTHLDDLVADAEQKLNKYEQYRVKIAAAEEFDDAEKMQEVYQYFEEDDDLFEEQKIAEFLATEINKEEQKANSYIAKAEKVGERQVTLSTDISKAKVRKNSTKNPDEKEEIQLEINDIEAELAPLESEKERLYTQAESHSAVAKKLTDQLSALNAYQEQGLENNQIIAEVSPEQKKALIASITATSLEIEALVENSSTEMKIDGPTGVFGSDETASSNNISGRNETSNGNVAENSSNESSSTEIITGGTPDDISQENTSSSTEKPKKDKTPSNSKYFAYTDEYEEPVDDVALIEGESIPLVITSSTGKREYTPEELAKEQVNLKPSAYQGAFKLDINEAQTISNRNEKAKKLQYLNYNLIVNIEKEIAVLTYAKSKNTSDDYALLLDDKIEKLESQAKQKRNFLALNSQIIKQLETQEQQAVEEGEKIAEKQKEEQTAENVKQDDLKTEVLNQQSAESGNQSENLASEVNYETPTERVNSSENKTVTESNDASKSANSENINVSENEETFGNTESSTEGNGINESKSTENVTSPTSKHTDVVIKKAAQTPGAALITQIEAEKAEQEAAVSTEKAELSNLQTQLNGTKKKKQRRQIQKQVDKQVSLLKLEEEKLKLTNQKKAAIASTLDVVTKDPLATRPSVEKYVEAQSQRNAYKTAEGKMDDLEDKLSTTRKRKKKRAIQSEMDALDSEVEFKRMQYEMAIEIAKEVEEVEVLALKSVTPYGSEIMVVLPQSTLELTAEEKKQVENSTMYKEYQAEVSYFNKSLNNASVMYQSASLKEKAVKELDAQIDSLNRVVVNLPKEEQSEVLSQIEEIQAERTRLVREAEVFYAQAKSTTNEAYYQMNEANAKLLTDGNATEREKVIAMVQGKFTEPIPINEQEDILDMADTPAAGSTNINVIPKKLSRDIFVTSNKAYYSKSNPIPVDVQLPEGVVLKVQVGAFRNKISSDVFKGFAPIVAEKTGSGLTRYTAGLFRDFESANKAKASIRAKGYSDAFVVAYLNGKRITIADARRLLGGEITASEVASGVGSKSSNPTVQAQPTTDVVISNVTVLETKSSNASGSNVKVASVAARGDLYFTVQVGVYNQSVKPSSVFKITPLNSDQISGGLVRYSSGIYASVSQAVSARNRIVKMGISDAFVTAYYNGNRITVAEAKRIASQNGGEIVKSNISSTPTNTSSSTVSNQPVIGDDAPIGTTATKPKRKNVPVGNYYVEIGPYNEAIPIGEARVILSLGSLGVIVVKKSGTTIYKIGNFTDVQEANALRDDLISKGLTAPEVKKSE